VPTASEAGLPGFEASAWYAIVVPKNAPEVVRGVNAVVNAWLTSEKGRAVLTQNGMQGVGGSASDLNAFIASELDKWGPNGNAVQYSTHRVQYRIGRVPRAEPHTASLAVVHRRWEPYAGKPHVRFCAGRSEMGVPTAT
jgi:hypothetical protein